MCVERVGRAVKTALNFLEGVRKLRWSALVFVRDVDWGVRCRIVGSSSVGGLVKDTRRER